MLVDAGANVNVKHQKTGLTPLQVCLLIGNRSIFCRWPAVTKHLMLRQYALFLIRVRMPIGGIFRSCGFCLRNKYSQIQGRTAFEMVMSVHNRRASGAVQNAILTSTPVGIAKTDGWLTHILK